MAILPGPEESGEPHEIGQNPTANTTGNHTIDGFENKRLAVSA
jgi:hypothetical protein